MLTRSFLFVPGINEKLISKAEELSADIIIYDLEDAVSLEQKAEARELIANALKNTAKSVVVRINSIDTPFFINDVLAIIADKTNSLKGIMLPKANNEADVIMLDRLLGAANIDQSVEIIPLLETAQGVQNASEIALSSSRVKRLAFGSVDFSLDINAKLTKEGTEILFARSKIVLASRAANIEQPIDTVFIDFKDHDGMLNETKMVKDLGFGSKFAIHPSQINAINQTFLPTNEEIIEANEIMDIVNRNGTAVFQLHGKMVDEPIIKKAKQIQAQANLLKLSEQN